MDWSRAERLLGGALPDDYKALAEAYGVGWFSEWIMANLPDSPCPQFDLLHVAEDTEWRRSGRDHQPGTILYAFHPEPSGLIHWGYARAADDLWWLPVTDDPASWRIVACDDEGGHWAEFECTTTQFIHRLLTQQLQLPWSDHRPWQPASFGPMPVPPGSDWDPRPEGLLRQPDPVATRDGWQAIVRAAAAGHAQPAAPAQTPPIAHPVPADYLELLVEPGPGASAGVVDWRAVEAELGSGCRPTTGRSWSALGPARSTRAVRRHPVRPLTPLRPRRRECWAGQGKAPTPPGVFPVPSGLAVPAGLAVGVGKTSTAVRLYWRTDGPDPGTWPVVLYDEVDWIDCGRGFLDVLLGHLTGRNPLEGLIGFSPAWPPRWQPMRRSAIQRPTTAPE